MWQALLKKEFYETFSFLLVNGKTGERRSGSAFFTTLGLAVVAVGALGYFFWKTCAMFCAPLVDGGLTWMYFALASLLATGLSLLGSVFTTKSKLYEAKDNDFLLSMPIPAHVIFFSRMFGAYLYAFFFEAVAFVPAIACYVSLYGVSAASALGMGAVLLLSPLLSLAISCLLSWLIAFVTSKVAAKKAVTTVFSLLFFLLYCYLYNGYLLDKFGEYLEDLATYGESQAAHVRTYLYPFWKVGQACEGNFAAIAICAAIFLGAYLLVALLIERTYFRLATSNKGERRRTYREKRRERKSAFSALFYKEGKRFFDDPMVVLNGVVGNMLCVFLCVLLVCNGELREGVVGYRGATSLVIALLVCAVSSMNIVSSVSVSLEGNTLWLAQSMPISPRVALWAKFAFALVVTLPFALVTCLFAAIFLQVGVLYGVLTCLATAIYVCLFTAFGLLVNLRFPNFHWTSATACVKRSGSSVIAMFSGLVFVALAVGAYFWFGKYLAFWAFELVWIAINLLLFGLVCLWIEKRGTQRYARSR